LEQNMNIVSLQSDALRLRWNETTPAGLGAPIKDIVMFAALATLIFLATLWLIAIVAAMILEESGSKIVAALKGRSSLAYQPTISPIVVRFRQRPRAQWVLLARPRLRAAA
jgi:hypothetical protein